MSKGRSRESLKNSPCGLMKKEKITTINSTELAEKKAFLKKYTLKKRYEIDTITELVWDIMRSSLPRGAFFNKVMKQKEVQEYVQRIQGILSD